jgi:hypothetical protein
VFVIFRFWMGFPNQTNNAIPWSRQRRGRHPHRRRPIGRPASHSVSAAASRRKTFEELEELFGTKNRNALRAPPDDDEPPPCAA